MNNDHLHQLCELVTILDGLPGEAVDIMADHIDPDALIYVAEQRCAAFLRARLAGPHMSVMELHTMLQASYMDGFAAGAGWSRMKRGSAEQ